MDTIGLYIHLPWCVRKCPYCDFNSHPLHQALPEDDYLKALLADLEFEAGRDTGQSIGSIFFGGGTPSLFSDHAIGRILDHVADQYRLAGNIEVTLEANPGTAESANFTGYREAGVNRLSLGLQSLDNAMLQRLGRIHNAGESLAAYDKARKAGFENINLDLMFGLPEQSLTDALQDLSRVIALDPEHISWYQLTLEPNTAFARTPPSMPDSDRLFEIQEAGIEQLSGHAFTRYEVSAFSKAGLECRHNLNYWRFGDYLGIGAGAHGKLSLPEPARYARHRHPRQYMDTAGLPDVYQETRLIHQDELLFEFLMNHLRLPAGFLLADLLMTTGITHGRLLEILQPAIDGGLLILDGASCRCTDKGYRFLDDILLLTLPEHVS